MEYTIPQIHEMFILCRDSIEKVKVLEIIPLLTTDLLFCVHRAFEDNKVLVVSEFTTGLSLCREEVNIKTIVMRAQGILYEHSINEIREVISQHRVINSLNGPVCLQRIKI